MHTVNMIPIERIQVLNPRVRNQHIFEEIVENIDVVGLKRPITVSRGNDSEGSPEYKLVCGQGRLEAYQRLGATEIPAIVVEANEEDCLVMSLIENIARGQHPAIEVMQEIESLQLRGYGETEIAQKLGVSPAWVGILVGLMERGEERLIAAVEKGLIPISLAVTISRSDDAGVQEALADAYTRGILKGKKLTLVRRMLNQRAARGKRAHFSHSGKPGTHKFDAQQLMKIYQKEVDKQQLLMRKADITQKRLLFIVHSLKTLLQQDDFIAMLQEEGIHTIPAPLEKRMMGGQTP
ncbi:plasmid partitioning protein RepB C-terminal domain-containing protein [Dyella sp. 2HG41-7]|uniref:plasmid partitioning protein RepB C-terminal domain-containing protein n=1 Tax=Dyella sp. 2HG41-7 TaxID=2883239 RepID=UPI001F389217|nr:plasmid partitioning protein RepB C-terminal domain-containing protein [Dyella sp. 2HG41-7]